MKAGVECGFLTLSTAQVRDIFEPIVREVLRLIQDQIDVVRGKGDVVSAILLGTATIYLVGSLS